MLRIEGEWIGLGKPSSNRGNQRRNKFLAHVHEREAGRAEQIFKSSGYKKVQVHAFYVNRACSAVLIIIEHYQSPGAAGNLCDGIYLGTKSILEANVRHRHDERISVYCLFVIDSRNAISFGFYKLHFGASNPLCEPDMTHGRKLELTHLHFLPVLKVKGAGDAIDGRRGAGHDGNLI